MITKAWKPGERTGTINIWVTQWGEFQISCDASEPARPEMKQQFLAILFGWADAVEAEPAARQGKREG